MIARPCSGSLRDFMLSEATCNYFNSPTCSISYHSPSNRPTPPFDHFSQMYVNPRGKLQSISLDLIRTRYKNSTSLPNQYKYVPEPQSINAELNIFLHFTRKHALTHRSTKDITEKEKFLHSDRDRYRSFVIRKPPRTTKDRPRAKDKSKPCTNQTRRQERRGYKA